MKKSIYLPLHTGKAPYWLLNRMKKLAYPIIYFIIDEFGEKEFFNRISDPIFFQSFSNVLGFDWNSSGSTTVLTGVLKSVLNDSDLGIRVAGGKGREGIKTPEHIFKFSDELGIPLSKAEKLIKVSRFAAKVDNSAVQDGYDIYHHCIIFSKKKFTIIQQGMNSSTKMARRYHWQPEFKIECELPHSGIFAESKEKEVMDLTAKESRENKEVIVDLIKDGCFRRDYNKLLGITKYKESISVPRRINWKVVEKAYNLQPDRFEELLLIKGLGKGTIRALALIADIIYCKEFSKQDPAKYCFAVGGKDGVPFPVNRRSYDEIIEFFKDALKQAKLGDFEKINAMKRLHSAFRCVND